MAGCVFPWLGLALNGSGLCLFHNVRYGYAALPSWPLDGEPSL